MKQSVLKKSRCNLLIGMATILMPLAAAAQSMQPYPHDGTGPEAAPNMPATSPPGDTTFPSSEPATPSATPGYESPSTQPGAMGPIRSEEQRSMEERRAMERRMERSGREQAPVVVPKVITNPNDTNPNNY